MFRNMFKVLVGNSEGKRDFGGYKRKLGTIIKTNIEALNI
jgi:hypothetical protein